METVIAPSITPPPFKYLVNEPDKWALFLDFDGTLLELAERPDAIEVPPGLERLLDRLYRLFGGALAVITGRSLSDLDCYLPPGNLPAAGQHGGELRRGPGKVQVLKADVLTNPIRDRLARFAVTHEGLMCEDKGNSIALHYRGAPKQEPAILALAEAIVRESQGRLEVIRGKAVCELRPVGINKGTAVRAFLAEFPFCGRWPLMIGDDRTDEDAFAVALESGGAAIKVGAGGSLAQWRLADPGATRDWLRGALT